MSSKKREALEQIEAYASSHGLWDVEVIAKTALAEPLLNCEVGTAEEQYERFRDMCFKTNCEGLVKHNTLSEYAFEWAQMPYEAVK